jgi:hypothetical protein
MMLDQYLSHISVGINILDYPTDDKLWHLAHLLKPHRRGHGKTDPLKVLMGQSLEAKSQLLSHPSLAEMSQAR